MQYKFDKIKNNIRLIGRSVIQGCSLIMDMSASGFEFFADFKTGFSISFNVDEGSTKIGVITDNNYSGMTTADFCAGANTIAMNLSGSHLVRVVKLSEYNFGGLTLTGISLDGEFTAVPKEKPLKFEFYGDSLTCGYGCLSPDRATPKNTAFDENAYLTYCALISRTFGADISVSGASGFGIILSCGGNKDDTFHAFWDKASPKKKIPWDFKRFIPDVVFINLGTNDSEYCRNNKDYSVSYNSLYQELSEFVKNIRAYAPKSKIVFVTGVSGNIMQPGQIDVEKVYEDLEKEFADTYYISKMHTKQLGGDWHPNVGDHKDLADRLIVELEKCIPDIFAK